MKAKDTEEQILQLTAARLYLYQFLSRALEREADDQLLQVAATLAQANLLESAPPTKDIKDVEYLETLAVDYCSLFILPKSHLAPYQSVQSSINEFWGEAAYQMKSYLERLGITPMAGLLPDHAAIELAVMAQLLEWELAALQEKAADELGQLKQVQQEFYQKFLRWLPEYFDKMRNYAETAFYQNVATTGLDFLQNEAALLGS